MKLVDQKFEEAFKRKDELEEPIRPLDLDWAADYTDYADFRIRVIRVIRGLFPLFLLLLMVAQDCAARQLDFVAFDPYHLDRDLIAFFQNIAHVADAFFRNLRDMQKF